MLFVVDARGWVCYKYKLRGRMVRVSRARPDDDSDGDPEIGSAARIHYDGLGRRICKMVANSGDHDGTLHYYHDGQRMVESRDGSDQVLPQYVWVCIGRGSRLCGDLQMGDCPNGPE